MSYNGSGTFQINTSGQPVVAGTVISATAFNALTADLATGLSTAITKDGQTTTTARIPFAAGISSTLTTDSSSVSTGSIITAGGVGVAKNLYVGANVNVAGTLGVTGVATFSAAPIYSSLTASSAVATDASKGLVSVTNTGTGNNVLATSPTITTPTVSGDATISGLTVGKGAGAVSTNTAVGASALAANTTGSSETAFGKAALKANTTGTENTAVGADCLQANTTGSSNSVLGLFSMYSNTTGGSNTAIGRSALENNTTASYNTAVGYQAGYNITTGIENTFIGTNAGSNVSAPTRSVCVGNYAGYGLVASNTLYIARDNVGAGNAGCWIFGSSTGSCNQGNNSSSWTTTSDERVKNVLGDSTKGLAEIMQVEVKNFKYKTAEEMPEFVKNEQGNAVISPDSENVYTGAIAQQIQTCFPESVKIGEQGVLSVDSDPIFWAMLKAIQELKAEIDALKGTS